MFHWVCCWINFWIQSRSGVLFLLLQLKVCICQGRSIVDFTKDLPKEFFRHHLQTVMNWLQKCSARRFITPVISCFCSCAISITGRTKETAATLKSLLSVCWSARMFLIRAVRVCWTCLQEWLLVVGDSFKAAIHIFPLSGIMLSYLSTL